VGISNKSINAKDGSRVGVIVFNATFNNILVISGQSVLLVEETGENQQPDASY